MGMEMKQELEWNEAQKIVISEDLVAVAKRQLQFLSAVDRNRWLYKEGPALQRAIHRYNACWLPLLAKHTEFRIMEGPLVVPLDCEWVWHCHRLNPVRYKTDCEELYGRILDNHNVVSSIHGTSERETKEIWNNMYPDETYDLDLTRAFSDDISKVIFGAAKYTRYNLVSAIERQSPFFYQVSRPHMSNDLFLEAAVARYKGFLHLIKRNKERSIRRFCVPTYDIDLIWHSHQLNPVSYCKDLLEALGKVLEHDDTDSDRTKGNKLDVGFFETTEQWEKTFGSRYSRAGAMYRGSAPSPLITTPNVSNFVTKKVLSPQGYQKLIHLPDVNVVEVLLEFVELRNLPEGHKGSVYVLFSKTEPDKIFNAKRRLDILSESGEKQIASFHCQPSGRLLFTLVSRPASNLRIPRRARILGSTSISLEEFLVPVSNLSLEKWLELVPSPTDVNSKPISIRVAISFTVPVPAPYVLRMIRSRTFSKSSCFFPLPGRVEFAKSWTYITDEAGNEIISLHMRQLPSTQVSALGSTDLMVALDYDFATLISDYLLRKLNVISNFEQQPKLVNTRSYVGKPELLWSLTCMYYRNLKDAKVTNDSTPKKEVIGINGSGETHHLAALVGTEWSLIESQWSLQLQRTINKDGHLFELTGHRMVKLFPGRKLDYEPKHCEKRGSDCDFITAVEFSAEDPYGRAVALLDLKSGVVKVQEESLLLLATTLAFIFADILRKEGYKGITAIAENIKERDHVSQEANGGHDEGQRDNLASSVMTSTELNAEVARGNMVIPVKGGACSGSCGSGCGNVTKSGGCGGCGGGECGNMMKSGGCGGCGSGCGGCGGGCGNMMKSGGCGGCGSGCGGCGGGCGSVTKSGGCGGCGSGCGSMTKSGGCGGCGGGSILAHGASPCVDGDKSQAALQENEALLA
ncbi:hypothetical protein RJ640_010916 [Escallonia rubra]|uniref:Glycine-rich domain-containing protein 1 n=1 Tax=Escallonia rubra TaxID=112253 RepID=A0AA88RPE4_9ASTE|nr:hypothetical protein RJ640_010916 [Escallonia rubra]